MNILLKKNFIFLVPFVLIYLFATWTISIIRESNQVDSHTSELSKFYNVLNKNISYKMSVIHNTAANEHIRDVVASKTKPDNKEVRAVLEVVRVITEASICYVLNEDGIVVSSTRYSGDKSLTGNNYSFRPYFKEAYKGCDCVYPAIGVTTHKRGIYIASPVRSDDRSKVIGVMVFKISLDNFDSLLKYYENLCFLVSPDNIVFAATEDKYLFSSIGRLKPDVLEKIYKSKQFAGQKIKPVTFKVVGKKTKIDGIDYGVISQNLKIPGWKLISCYNLSVPTPLTHLQLIFVILSSSVIFVFIILLLSLIYNMKMDWNHLYKRLRTNIFIPTAVSLLVLVILIIGGGIWQFDSEHIHNEIHSLAEAKESLLNSNKLVFTCDKNQYSQTASNWVMMSFIIAIIIFAVAIFIFYWVFLGAIEKRVIETHKALEDEIAERLEIEENLEIAREQAVSATKAKSDFLAKMTHEIRTPMNGVLGMLDILLKTNLTHTQKYYTKLALNSAKGLLTIINDILDFSKIEAGRLTLSEEPFNLKGLLGEAGHILSFISSEKGLDLILRVQKSIPETVLGDPIRLKQILINLAGNAVKFTDDGYVKISLSCCSGKGANVDVTISIEDTGNGISKDDQKNLFEEFTQVDNSLTRKANGTGLGLAISRQLVRLMGGEITLSSTVGVGSVFSFTIPMRLPEKSDRNTQFVCGETDEDFIENVLEVTDSLEFNDEYEDNEHIQHEHINIPVKVLVVDDNIVNQKVSSIILTGLGCNVTLASDGQEAIKLVQEVSFDIVFMDGQMPIIDGFEATRRIRENEARIGKTLNGEEVHNNKRLPIISLSALGQDNNDKFLEAGADYVVSKPLTQESAIDAIVKFCDIDDLDDVVMPGNNNQAIHTNDSDVLSVFDSSYFCELANNDQGVMREFIETFIEDSSNYMSQIKDALYDCDYNMLSLSLHSLKGSLGYVGAFEFCEFIANLEKDILTDKHMKPEPIICELTSRFNELKSKLEKFLES